MAIRGIPFPKLPDGMEWWIDTRPPTVRDLGTSFELTWDGDPGPDDLMRLEDYQKLHSGKLSRD